MGRSQGSHHARSRVTAGVAAALLSLALCGCNGNYGYLVNVSSIGAPPPPSATISVTTTSAGGLFVALFGLGMMGVSAGALPFHDPGMHPDRRVLEQDCSRPIDDYSANLRCR